MSIDDSLRRIANQAFFDKLYLSEEGTVTGEPGEPFNAFFDPGVQPIAARHEGRAAESGSPPGGVVGVDDDVQGGAAGEGPASNGRSGRGGIARATRAQRSHRTQVP